MFRLGLALAALLLFGASLVVAGYARDEYHLWQVARDVDRWDARGGVDDDRLLARHLDTVAQVLHRYGGHADALFLSAKLHEWRAFLQKANPRHQARERAAAEDMLALTLRTRPFWGRAWAARFGNGLSSDAWTATDAHRLEIALALGRHDLQSQLYLLNIYFTHGRRLPPEVHALLAGVVRGILADGGEELMDYVRSGFTRGTYQSLYDAVRPGT